MILLTWKPFDGGLFSLFSPWDPNIWLRKCYKRRFDRPLQWLYLRPSLGLSRLSDLSLILFNIVCKSSSVVFFSLLSCRFESLSWVILWRLESGCTVPRKKSLCFDGAIVGSLLSTLQMKTIYQFTKHAQWWVLLGISTWKKEISNL